MALVRCRGHKPQGIKRSYADLPVEPVGYPDTALVCGSTGCENPGLIWLDTEELEAYKAGQRVFRIPNFATKIRAK